MVVVFNGFDLVNPISPHKHGVTQVNFKDAEYRGENVQNPFLDGRKWKKKLKDQKVITVSMQADTEDDVSYIHSKFPNTNTLGTFLYTLGTETINTKAEYTNFSYTAMPFNFKIEIIFVVPDDTVTNS